MTDAAELHHRFCNMCGRRKLPRAAADKIGEFLLTLKAGKEVDKGLQRATVAAVRKIRAVQSDS
jgi:hypothetical protein